MKKLLFLILYISYFACDNSTSSDNMQNLEPTFKNAESNIPTKTSINDIEGIWIADSAKVVYYDSNYTELEIQTSFLLDSEDYYSEFTDSLYKLYYYYPPDSVFRWQQDDYKLKDNILIFDLISLKEITIWKFNDYLFKSTMYYSFTPKKLNSTEYYYSRKQILRYKKYSDSFPPSGWPINSEFDPSKDML